MPVIDLKTTASLWPKLSNTIFVPRTETEYNRLVAMLDELIDEVGEDEAHPLASLMEIIGVMIASIAEARMPASMASFNRSEATICDFVCFTICALGSLIGVPELKCGFRQGV